MPGLKDNHKKKEKEYNREEYQKKKVVGTRLNYKDKYSSSEKKKESKSIKFLKNFNFEDNKEEKNCYYQKEIFRDLLRQITDVYCTLEDFGFARKPEPNLLENLFTNFFELKKEKKIIKHPSVFLSDKKYSFKGGFYDHKDLKSYLIIVKETKDYNFKKELHIHPELANNNWNFVYLYCINFPVLYSGMKAKDILNPNHIISTLNHDINLWVNDMDEDDITIAKSIEDWRKLKKNVIPKKESDTKNG